MTGIRSEKRIIRRFNRCMNVTERTYTKLDIYYIMGPPLYMQSGVDRSHYAAHD